MESELIPLDDLSPIDVELVLSKWNFVVLVPKFKEKSVNGSMIDCIESADDLEDFGVDQRIMRNALYKRIRDAKAAGGIPKIFFPDQVLIDPWYDLAPTLMS